MAEAIDAVVAGHICLDVTPRFLSQGRTLTELFRPGSLVNVGPAVVSTGGPVSNTGFPMRRLGMNVKLMGKCGRDVFGQALMDIIRAEATGAEEGMHVVGSEKTSYSVVVAPPGVDRIFLHCPGSNDTFGAEDIDLGVVAGGRLFHFGYPPLMARTYANGGDELVKMFQAARATGVTTSLDMAYPDPSGPAGKVGWAGILSRTLPLVDVFTPSVEELTFMLSRSSFDDMAAQSAGREMVDAVDGDLLRSLGERCLEMGAGVVLIKCGYLGLYVRTAGRGRLKAMGRARPRDLDQWANREIFEPGFVVEHVVSATGAGDCAIAGFLTALLRGCSLEDAACTACTVGAQNVAVADAISGIKTWDQTVYEVRTRPLPRRQVTIPLPRFRYDQASGRFLGPAEKH